MKLTNGGITCIVDDKDSQAIERLKGGGYEEVTEEKKEPKKGSK